LAKKILSDALLKYLEFLDNVFSLVIEINEKNPIEFFSLVSPLHKAWREINLEKFFRIVVFKLEGVDVTNQLWPLFPHKNIVRVARWYLFIPTM
jgi:hypothetical protein